MRCSQAHNHKQLVVALEGISDALPLDEIDFEIDIILLIEYEEEK